MDWQAWITLGVTSLVIATLALTRYSPDIIMVGGLAILLATGIVSPAEGFAGLANPGVITVAVLFVVAAGLSRTGGLDWVAQNILGRPKSIRHAQARVMFPVAIISAFLNNTPVVAMFVPTVVDWARKHHLGISRLLMPLSFAAILGGMCTLIGTSTNLVVNGLLMSEAGHPGLGMFEIAWVGLPCALVGMAYLLLFGRRLLKDRKPALNPTDDPREYTVKMVVEGGSALVGKTIENAGLRHLPGMYLMAIERENESIIAVGPKQKLQADDRLVFVGVVESVVDLQRIRGLKPATDQVFKLDVPRDARCLIEAVVSDSFPLCGKSIRVGRFRRVYGWVVVAVARNGHRLRQKIGDILLRPGDTLLLEAPPSFVGQQRNSRDFFLISAVQDFAPPRHEKAWIAVLLLAAMVLTVSLGLLDMLQAAMITAGLMILTRCLRGSDARGSVNWQILVTIAAAFGLGQAIMKTGLAAEIAQLLIGWAGRNPWVALAVITALASVLNGIITSNAAAVLVFPIALTAALEMDANILPFAIAIMITSAGSFATPLGYQTNLMVFGPGGYRFSDYLRLGLPLNILIWALAVGLTPLVWPF